MQREQSMELPEADGGLSEGPVDGEPALPDSDVNGEPDANPLALGNAITNLSWFRHADSHGITFSFGYTVRFPDAISHADAERHANTVSASVRRWMHKLRDASGGHAGDADAPTIGDGEPDADA